MLECPACGKLAVRCHIVEIECKDCPDHNKDNSFPICNDYDEDSQCDCDIEAYTAKCIELKRQIGRLLTIIDELTVDPNNKII